MAENVDEKMKRVDTERTVRSDDNAHDDRGEDESGHKFGFWQASAFNAMMMFGTGPFITIPSCIFAVDPPGPHALIGYGIALIACFCDSLVCGEIASMWPYSGGSATYLRNLYGPDGIGQLVCFLYVVQFLVAGPAEIASGFIAISEYLAYFNTNMLGWHQTLISLAALFLSTLLLYRNVKEIGWVTLMLCAVMLGAVIFTLIFGFANIDVENLQAPRDAFSGGINKILLNAAATTRFGIYDMTGYYDVCFMGDEIVNAKRNIRITCIFVCGVIGVVTFLVYVAVLGHLGTDRLGLTGIDQNGGALPGVMSVFWESISGSKTFTGFFTIIVCVAIFGSAFSMMAGFQHLLSSVSKDGYFFDFFARRHPKLDIPHVALIVLSGVSAIWCFFSLEIVIDAMTTLLVLVQFMGQSGGLLYYRYTVPKDEQVPGWHMPLFPLPAIIQFILFGFILISSPSRYFWETSKGVPILEMSAVLMIIGVCMFLVRAKRMGSWPFATPSAADGPSTSEEDSRSSDQDGYTLGKIQSEDEEVRQESLAVSGVTEPSDFYVVLGSTTPTTELEQGHVP